MSTNPIGPNTRNVTVNFTDDDYIALKKLAGISAASLSEYIRALADYAVKHKLVAGKNLESMVAWEDAIRSGVSPMPKVKIEIKAGAPALLGGESSPNLGSITVLENMSDVVEHFAPPTLKAAEEPRMKKKSAG